jgi:cytochrome c556
VEAPRGVRDQARSSELGLFMKTQLNPSFSKLSFLLFHDDGESDIDASALPASALQLERAATALRQWTNPPTESEQGTLVFFEYAEAMKLDAERLAGVLEANERDAAVPVFESLRTKCDSCHHFFRFDDSATVERTSHVAQAR